MQAMQIADLPHGKAPAPVTFPHFPTLWQTVVWRNWGLVPTARLAQLLRTTPKIIEQAAAELALPEAVDAPEIWTERGYTTIIRKNWHLLPYEQLLMLLDWTPARLAFALKEDDFLWHKLGDRKPNTPPVYFTPLTPPQQRATERIRKTMLRYFPERSMVPAVPRFSFIQDSKNDILPRPVKRKTDPGADASQPMPTTSMTLNNTWRLIAPDRPGHYLAGYIARWQERLFARWKLRLQSATTVVASSKNIVLELLPETAGLPPESHTIDVQPNHIRISAVDSAGLMRALDWLEHRMTQLSRPCLPLGVVERKTRFTLRCIYPYYLLYGDPLADPAFQEPPAGLLAQYANLGVNAIWLQGVLYKLTDWPGIPQAEARERAVRLAALRRLTAAAAEYGIGVYLYLNEPRCMPIQYFDQFPEWRGLLHNNGLWSGYCTSQPAVRELLRAKTAELFRNAPELAGAFLITMSENLSNCYSKWWNNKPTDCPRCSPRDPSDVIAEVNRAIAEGIFSAKPNARVIAWTWGWKVHLNHERVIKQLAPGTTVMCTSEEAMPLEKGGIKNILGDYSISNPGPGELARAQWKTAHAAGLPAAAKVQLNNSWECPAIPWLPAGDLVREHIANLTREPIDALLLSWTLGGYPSFNLKLAAKYYWDESGTHVGDDRLPALLRDEFGADAAPLVGRALRHFSEAFREFPFQVRVLYVGPQNPGPANLLFEKPTGYMPTMVGFPYDALNEWRGLYPIPVFEAQFQKLSVGWRKGLPLLTRAAKVVSDHGRAELAELTRMAWSTWTHFRSTYLQTAFIRTRDSLPSLSAKEQQTARDVMRKILNEEIALARRLHDLTAQDATIGFEATNQYAYTTQDLREKVLNCEWLRARLSK